MEAGISSYSYTWATGVPGFVPGKPMNVFDLINKAAELNVKVVQIADNLPLENFTVQELKSFRLFADQAGIHFEIGARGMTHERLRKYLNIAHLMGASILRFVIDGPDFEPGLDEIHAIIQGIVADLEDSQITLAIENHDRLLAREFVEIVKNAKTDRVGICLDTVNSMGAGEGLETVIDLLAPLTVNLHVKEFLICRLSHKMGFIIKGAPLGKGMLPVSELIRKVSPKCPSAILEQWVPPESNLQETIKKEEIWAEESISYLKTILT